MMHICIQRFYFISSLTVPRLNFDLAANLRVYEGGCSWNENDPLKTGQVFVKKLGEFVRRAALGTFPWPVYDQASIFFSKHISGLHTAFWLRDALLSIWSRMCRVLYVFDHACIWPRVLIGHACIWPHVYLAMRVSGHTCIWLCLYLGHVRFW
jgi:hypothetical protein